MKSILRSPALRLAALCLLACLLCVGVSAADGETLYNSEYCFTETDFDADTLANLTGVFVTDVPDENVAVIYLGERIIRAGDVLPVSALGRLTLAPACRGNCDAVLTYQPICDTHLEAPAQLTIRIKSGKNETPKAIDTEFETYKNIANDGKLTGTDAENSPLTFQLVDMPKRGNVKLNEDGTYVYTPSKNKVGEDSFTFTVTDDAGNVSKPATVKIKILKPSDSKTFADLQGTNDQFEAMWMRSNGLCSGRSIGGTLCYTPLENVSRSEFLVMAMELCDIPVNDALTVSGFSDAQDAPAWVQPYLSSAMRHGIVSGMIENDALVFRPNDAITGEQAAVLLQNILELPISAAATDTTVTAWAAEAVQALSEAGIRMDADSRPLTRIEAAKLLYQISKLV